MTREESIKRLDEKTFKELDKESSGDFISREQAKHFLYERLDKLNDDELYDIFSRIIDDMYNELSFVGQEPYKDFCEFVAKMVLRDDFEENAGANAEFLCRKLSKLGIVKTNEDEWVLVESEDEK